MRFAPWCISRRSCLDCGVDSVEPEAVGRLRTVRGDRGMASVSQRMLVRGLRLSMAAAALAIIAAVGAADRAAAQGAVKSVHSDWQVRCDTPPGAQGEQCALIQ